MTLTVPVPPAQLINGPAVILSGPALAELHALIQWGIRYVRSRDGITPTPHLLAVAGLIKRAADQQRAMSEADGHPARTSSRDEASSTQQTKVEPQELTARDAAAILGYSDRHVRRIAPELGVVSVKPMRFARATVEAYHIRRRAERRQTA